MSKTWSTPRSSGAALGAFTGSVAILLLAAPAALAQHATIKGEIHLPGTGLGAASRLSETVVQIRTDREASAGDAVRPTDGTRVEIRSGRLARRVIAVPVGSTVEFVNRDDRIHNLVSSSPAKKFDLGMTAPGESGSVSFERPGVVRVICKADAPIEAFVVVMATNHFAVADDRGRYEIRDLAPGAYVLDAWNPRYGSIERPVSIPRDGDVVTATVEFHGG